MAGTLRLEKSEMIELFAFQPQTDRPVDRSGEGLTFLEMHVSVTGQTEGVLQHTVHNFCPLYNKETSLLSVPEMMGRTWPTSARQMISLGLLHRTRA